MVCSLWDGLPSLVDELNEGQSCVLLDGVLPLLRVQDAQYKHYMVKQGVVCRKILRNQDIYLQTCEKCELYTFTYVLQVYICICTFTITHIH